MTIAQQLLAFYTIKQNENHNDINFSALMDEAEEKASEVTQDWENGATEYDFVDSSVLIVCGNEVRVYAQR